MSSYRKKSLKDLSDEIGKDLLRIEYHSLKSRKIHDILKDIDARKEADKQCLSQFNMLNKQEARTLCDCLYKKNGNLSIVELEDLIEKKEETPGSICVNIYDESIRKSKSRSKSRSKSKSFKSSKKSRNYKN